MTASAAALGVALASTYGVAAMAQDATTVSCPAGQVAVNGQCQAQPQEIVVTGSRIVRRDYTSDSPILTLNAKTFEQTSNIAIEATLNKLPQFSPDQNMTGAQYSGDVQPTATHTIGISTLSLRGLGPNRNLVLVDGRRLMPTNGELAIDVNSIPSAMIDHVEVITGGASAVYGPDAIGGVVNFILKKDYEGLTIDSQYGETQAGDGQEFKMSSLLGTDFAGDKGNITFGIERYSRNPSWQYLHDFYSKAFTDPNVGTNEFFATTIGYAAAGGNGPSAGAVASVFPGATGVIDPTTTTFQFQGDGSLAGSTIWSGVGGLFGANGAAGFYKYAGPINTSVGYSYYGIQISPDPTNGYAMSPVLKTEKMDNYITAPLDRWSIYTQGHYDITDNLTFFASGNYATTHTHTILFPSPFITGWTTQIPYDAATDGAGATINEINGFTGLPETVLSPHQVPTELATLLNSRANPNAPWTLSFTPTGWMPPRSDDITNEIFQVQAGFDGKLPFNDWTWELVGSHGQSSSYDLGLGYASLTRFQDLMQQPNFGADATITGNQVAPNYGFGAATVHCTSGFGPTIFSGGFVAPSQDCINAITAKLQSRTFMTQEIVEFDTQGKLFDLPAGELRASLGADYREDSLQFNPDILQSVESFTDQVVGVYPAAYMNASTSVREGYGELLVPILKDLPLVKDLSLDLGLRYSTYTANDQLNKISADVPGGWTYKAEASWTALDWVRFRGSYNLATRAPNLGELFLGQQETYAAGGGTLYGDPCSLLATAPFGANPTYNPTGAAGAKLICEALMTPTGAAQYYGAPQIPGAASPFGFVEQEGNPNTQPEKATTFTAGVVLKSPWEMPLLSRTQLSVDWYYIRINHAIEFEPIDYINQLCLSQPAADAAAAQADATDPLCTGLIRNPGSGAQGTTLVSYNNLATLWTSGIDIEFDWSADLADVISTLPGTLGVNISVNVLNRYDTAEVPSGALSRVTDWVGSLGPTLQGTDPGAYNYRIYTTFSYAVGPATFSLRWRHLPGVIAATAAEVNSGFPGAFNSTLPTPAYDEFDFSGTWSLTDHVALRAGIDNLMDKDPPTTGATTGLNIPGLGQLIAASDGQGLTNEGFYDALGRRFYGGLTLKF